MTGWRDENMIFLLLILTISRGAAAQAQQPGGRPADEIVIRQQLVQTALGREAADLVIRGATVLNVHTLTWAPDQDIVVKGQRIAWIGPSNAWNGTAARTARAYGMYEVPGFGESHKHIESTHLTPEFEAALTLPHGNTRTVEDSYEFGNVTSDHNVEFWLAARKGDRR